MTSSTRHRVKGSMQQTVFMHGEEMLNTQKVGKKYVSKALSQKHPLTNIVRKQIFNTVVVPHLPKAEPIKKAEPELRKRERAAVALQRNHNGYMQAKGLKIVQDVEEQNVSVLLISFVVNLLYSQSHIFRVSCSIS